MYAKAPIDMYPTASAVELRRVTKTFTQWQRGNTGKNLLRNLIHPEKRVITALDDVSLSIQPGEFVAYAGPNGAGKSTTMKLLGGMLLPTAGELEVLGMTPHRQRVRLMGQMGILFGNRTELWWDHPVIQSFEWKKVVWRIPEEVYQKNLQLVTQLLEIGDLLKTFARELSLGQRMRADLAMMLLHSPRLILLDEPTLGLDVVAKRQMIAFLKKINSETGVTIVVTSHDMNDLEEMARRIIMISKGKVAYDGNFSGLRANTGSLTYIQVTMGNQAVPRIPGSRLISHEMGVCRYEVDLTRLPVRDFLAQLAALEDIRDIEIEKPSMEQVITELYQRWKAV